VNRPLEFMFKLLIFLILLPCLVPLVLGLVVGVVAAILPWLLLCSLIAGIAAGLTKAIVTRALMPTRSTTKGPRPAGPPLRGYRVRRSKGGGPAGRRP
jgi:hypothetical protein